VKNVTPVISDVIALENALPVNMEDVLLVHVEVVDVFVSQVGMELYVISISMN
jgi:hypothetical protein